MSNQKNRYYQATCKCGHCGKKKYIIKNFGILATSKKEAARIAREIPRVKHDHDDAILNVKEINYEEYLELNERNDNDPYFRCTCRRDQKLYCPDLYLEMIEDSHYKERHDYYDKEENGKLKRWNRIYYKCEKENLKYTIYEDDYED